MKRAIGTICASVLLATASAAQAESPWGTNWGDTFEQVSVKLPDAARTEAPLVPCSTIANVPCGKYLLAVENYQIAGTPYSIRFSFTAAGRLAKIMLTLTEAERYSPGQAAIKYNQMRMLLTESYGTPLASTEFALIPNAGSGKNIKTPWLDGRGSSVWHTKDSLVDLQVAVIGATSADVPTSSVGSTMLWLTYSSKPKL